MLAAAKTHLTKVSVGSPILRFTFKRRTPRRVVDELTTRYRRYLVIEKADDESVDWFKTDLHRGVSAGMTPGKHVRTLREMCGWSQAFLGEKIGVSPARVSDYEHGRVAISKVTAKRFAGLFNVSPARFI